MTHLTQLLPAILAVFSMSIAMPARADDGGRTLFDFAEPDAAQPWQPVNDGVMGGVSDGRFKITDRGWMEFFGTLSLENNGGFASVRSRRNDLGLKPEDSLLIRLRGDGREYLLNLYVPTLQVAYSYRAPIPTRAGEWTEARIPVKDCYATSFGRNVPDAGPVDAPKINSIGFMVSDKKAGPFKLEIAWVKVLHSTDQASQKATTSPGRSPATRPAVPPKRSVLIVDGMNNHDWERATRILKEILLESGRFTVDVSTSPPASATAEQWQGWKPDFARYDVVVINFNGGHTSKGVHWPKDVEMSLEDYVSKGGGLVSYHAANNSFPDWPAYNRMIGLGWREKGFGPSLVVGSDGKVVEVPKGQGRNPGHGPEHDFVVTVLDADHPITRGMPKTWMHPHEQLTHGQHGPAKDMTVLTYAYSKDTKQNEVMDWVVPYGKGRVYTTMLGHLWKDGPEAAMRCVGFQTMLIHGVEWAAAGDVSYPVPEDFPTASEIKLRSGEGTTATNPPEGFKAVFNGRDLTGWEGSPAYWSVEDGCLTGKADGTLKFNRFITWRGGTVGNFELRVKVWVSPTGNSGLQYRGTERPDLGESVVTGYQCDVVANRPDYNGMLYEERGRRILAHTGEKVIIDPQGQPWVVGRFPLREFKPGEWHDYRVLAECNHQRHWIDGHPTADVIDLDEKGRKLDGVLAVQVHVGPPITIRYKDFFLKALPDDLPLIRPEQATIPPDAPKVVPQGQDKPRKPDAE